MCDSGPYGQWLSFFTVSEGALHCACKGVCARARPRVRADTDTPAGGHEVAQVSAGGLARPPGGSAKGMAVRGLLLSADIDTCTQRCVLPCCRCASLADLHHPPACAAGRTGEGEQLVHVILSFAPALRPLACAWQRSVSFPDAAKACGNRSRMKLDRVCPWHPRYVRARAACRGPAPVPLFSSGSVHPPHGTADTAALLAYPCFLPLPGLRRLPL